MKYLTVLLVVVAATFFNAADAKVDKEKKAEIIKECQAESGASNDDVERAKKHELPNTPQGKCLLACGFRKYGFLKDGKMDLEGVNKFFEQALDEQEHRDKAIKVAAGCVASEDVKGLDECEAAVKYMQCAKKDPEFASLPLDL